MVDTFDRIGITVPDLAVAEQEYRLLLGVASRVWQESPDQPASAWLLLPNTVIELVQAPGDSAAIGGIAFSTSASEDEDEVVANTRGLDIRLCSGASTLAHRARYRDADAGDFRVDHVVLQTASADECIELFGKQLGIRLALDKSVPEWGGRMLFFRTGKLTLEVIESQREKPDADYFWGIAYQCADLEQTAQRLAARNVILSEIRTGRKPGSLVATVKSHCLGIPTLLIQPS